MRAGRKATPTALKVLHGNPGKRRLPLGEPMPERPLSSAPEWFTDEQLAAWEYAMAEAPPGLLRTLDRSLLTAWVVAEDFLRQAAQAQAKSRGLLVNVAKKGAPRVMQQSPYLSIINKQSLIMMRAAAELGFTPSSRPRMADGGANGRSYPTKGHEAAPPAHAATTAAKPAAAKKPPTGARPTLNAFIANNPDRKTAH